jgi:rare lipoprotein A
MRYRLWAARAAALALLVLAAGTVGGAAKARMGTDAAEAAAAEQGMATWYGPGYDGQRTACGTVFNSAEYTAASTTLPCGCVVTVTNLQSGAAVTVTVTDRGAFRYPIVVDLSATAFTAIAYLEQGTVPVTVAPTG